MEELKKQIKELIDGLNEFQENMFLNFINQIEDKGLSFENMDKSYLAKCLREHEIAENWIDVANYAFLLSRCF